MSLASAFESVEASNYNLIMNQTWGHLGAEVGKHYGHMIFCVGQYGDLTIISSDWGTAGQSPWLLDAENEFMDKDCELEVGVYRVDGYYQMYKNGNSKVCGKIKRIPL